MDELATQLATIADRVEFIELLNDAGPLETREIVDNVDESRSTVTRVLRELRNIDVIEKTDQGYVTTHSGTVAAREYRRHESAMETVFEGHELLEAIPESSTLPVELFGEESTIVTAESDSFRPLEFVSERIQSADSIRAYLPTLVNPYLVRTLHDRVGDLDPDDESELIFDPELLNLLKGQYPRLLSQLAHSDGFSAYTASDHPYAIILTTTEGTTNVTIVVYDENAGIRGVLAGSSRMTVEWAKSEYERLRAGATTVTDELASLTTAVSDTSTEKSQWKTGAAVSDEPSGTASETTDLPLDLQSEGFTRLSDEYFNAHDTAPPEVSWQTGFTLSEVREGHTIDRRATDDEQQATTDQLIDVLRNSVDHVVLGPPGTGKSTVCMAVACEWFDSGYGTVLYREGGVGNEFDSTALLKAYLRNLDGHTLIVVEDAVRRGGSDIFEVIQSLEGHDGVTFLLDSRLTEWNDPDVLPTDPRLNAYRQQSIQQVTVPGLNAEECERILTKYERLVDAEVGISGEELVAMVAEEKADDDDPNPLPGEILLAQHHLTHRTTPIAENDLGSLTTLEADARQIYQSLLDADEELASDLAVLVNLLNAAGIPVALEYLYALAPEGDLGAIQQAVPQLEGQLLFGQDALGKQSTTFRTHHETWAVRFLEQVLEVTSNQQAREVFGRCVSRLVSLAGDEGRRRQIERQIEGAAPHIHRIDSSPQRWADEAVRRIFLFGESHTTLNPFYGTADDDHIDISDYCSTHIRQERYYLRAKMQRIQGNLDLAEQELDYLQSNIVDQNDSDSQLAELKMKCYQERGFICLLRADYKKGITEFEQVRLLAENTGNEVEEARAQLFKSTIDAVKGNYERAAGELDEVLDFATENRYPSLKLLSIQMLGFIDLGQGRIDRGLDRTERAIDLEDQQAFRDSIVEMCSVGALINAGYFEQMRNNFDTAETYLIRARSIATDRGFARREIGVHTSLGKIALKRGELAEAEKYLQRAYKQADNNETERWIGASLTNLAALELERGDNQKAADIAQDALDACETADDSLFLSDIYEVLTRNAIERSDSEAAETRLEQAHNVAESINNDPDIAKTIYQSARLALEQGETDTSEERTREALDIYAETERSDRIASCLRLLGEIALRRDELDDADMYLTDALNHAEESGVVRVIAETHDTLSRLRVATGELDAARRHLEEATLIYEDLGNADRIRELLEKLVSLHSTLIDDDGTAPSLETMHEIAERNNLQNVAEKVAAETSGHAD